MSANLDLFCKSGFTFILYDPHYPWRAVASISLTLFWDASAWERKFELRWGFHHAFDNRVYEE